MKKLFGIEAEINVTADEDIIKGIGKGVSNGSIILQDIFNEVKAPLINCIVNKINQNKKEQEK